MPEQEVLSGVRNACLLIDPSCGTANYSAAMTGQALSSSIHLLRSAPHRVASSTDEQCHALHLPKPAWEHLRSAVEIGAASGTSWKGCRETVFQAWHPIWKALARVQWSWNIVRAQVQRPLLWRRYPFSWQCAWGATCLGQGACRFRASLLPTWNSLRS